MIEVAASIWGARSANGVIVVTTKKGKKDKVQVDAAAASFKTVTLSTSFGFILLKSP
jgi:hypothetical protein